MGAPFWTPLRLKIALEASEGACNGAEAAQRVSDRLGRRVTAKGLSTLLRRGFDAGVIDRCLSDVLADMYGRVNTDKFNPVKPRAFAPDAYDVIGGQDGWVREAESQKEPGSWSTYALWSDLHIGSDDCHEEAIQSFHRHAIAMGARDFLCAGDWCDGLYPSRGGYLEQKHVGIDKHVTAFLDLIPEVAGVNHWIIDGNHEHKYYVSAGAKSGKILQNSAMAAGRKDINFLGYQSAQVTLHGIKFGLTHYRAGQRKAPIRYLQQRMDSSVPDVLVGGHYHIYDLTHVRGCLCIQPGAFQRETDFMSGTEFHPVGGVILYVQHTQQGPRYMSEFVHCDTGQPSTVPR